MPEPPTLPVQGQVAAADARRKFRMQNYVPRKVFQRYLDRGLMLFTDGGHKNGSYTVGAVLAAPADVQAGGDEEARYSERVVILDARSRQMPPEWAAGGQSNNLGEIAALTLAQEMLPPNVAADLYTDSSVARTAWIKTTTPKENVDLSIRKCVRQEWGVSKHAMGVMQELGEEILVASES